MAKKHWQLNSSGLILRSYCGRLDILRVSNPRWQATALKQMSNSVSCNLHALQCIGHRGL